VNDMNILIADDHAVVRNGVKLTLSEEFSESVYGEAADGQETIKAVLDGAWDLVILDISMPGRSGLEVLKELKSLRPQLPVLMFSMYSEEQYAIRALRAGAAGYITKASISEELVKAVLKIVAGGRYVSTELAERLAGEIALASDGPRHEALSDRELQILCLIGSGKAVKEIARELSLSVSTVSTHRARILEKMKMQTTVELIRYVLEHKLIAS
jgi:two-component system, NarL family, invasion response regulator UvrY